MTTKGKGFMAKGPNTIDQNFAEKLFKYGRERVPEYSRLHPVVPQLYVQEWKTDMKNRKLIMQNAEIGGVPKYEHDENLFLDKREQMHYNVEDRTRVESKYPHMDRAKLLRPDFHHETSKYQSELMFRRDAELVQGKVPEYSRLHPVVPQLYVQEWKTDMKNRKLIMQNAEIGGVPKYEHDENLFLDKREQMHYNVEDRTRVESKYPHMDRAKLLRPDFHHETSKYQSELMFRRDAELVQGK